MKNTLTQIDDFLVDLTKIEVITNVIAFPNPSLIEYYFSFQINGQIYSIRKFGNNAKKECEDIWKYLKKSRVLI
jgi:hypothetical protein